MATHITDAAWKWIARGEKKEDGEVYGQSKGVGQNWPGNHGQGRTDRFSSVQTLSAEVIDARDQVN